MYWILWSPTIKILFTLRRFSRYNIFVESISSPINSKWISIRSDMKKNIVKIFCPCHPALLFCHLTEVTHSPIILPPDSSSVSGLVSIPQLTSRTPENILHKSLEETVMQRGGEEAGSLTNRLPLEPLWGSHSQTTESVLLQSQY